MAEHWPVVFLGYELMYFFNTKVDCQQIVVMPANKLCPDDFWDIREALVVQHAVDIISAFSMRCLGLPGLLVFSL